MHKVQAERQAEQFADEMSRCPGPWRSKSVRGRTMHFEYPIIIVGGGPVGVVTALALARQGHEVKLFEAEARVDDSPRAATTHAATLEMVPRGFERKSHVSLERLD